MKTRLIYLAVLLLPVLEGCFQDSPRVAESGTGSETTNHIAGIVTGENGSRSARTRVLLVESGFNPLLDTVAPGMQDTTDAQGRFEILNPVPGDYQVEAHDQATGKHALLGKFSHRATAETLSEIRLQAPGTLQVTLPESLWMAGGYVFIPGTTVKTIVGESRVTTLAPVPAMTIPVLAYAADPGSPFKVLAMDLVVQAGGLVQVKLDPKPDTIPKIDTVPKVDTVPLPLGLGSPAVFQVNTTALAANIGEDVTGFPLLIRLDSSNFDFLSGPPSGVGIEFLDSAGNSLPFEVERWSIPLREAEVWVRMPVVKGNSLTRPLVMKWPTLSTTPAMDHSTPGQVFTSRDGFAGVWHLGETGTRRVDAVGIHDGFVAGYEGDEVVEGVVGEAEWLDAGNDLVNLGSVNVVEKFSISLWVRPEPTLKRGRVLGKGMDASGVDQIYSFLWDKELQGPLFSLEDKDVGTSLLQMVPVGTSWFMLYGVYDGTKASAYSDGRPVNNQVITANLPQNNISTLIGASNLSGLDKYSGGVDEVRIESVPRSAAWIKLCYENQRAGQILVKRLP